MKNTLSVTAGDTLPTLKIPITARLIVSGAIATQDFEDVHHDKAAANSKGTPDIFMNILTTNGLVGRYLTDWAGTSCKIKRIQLKLGTPNFPGDIMILSGEVISMESQEIQVNFKGRNGMGNHVTGVGYLSINQTEPKQSRSNV